MKRCISFNNKRFKYNNKEYYKIYMQKYYFKVVEPKKKEEGNQK